MNTRFEIKYTLESWLDYACVECNIRSSFTLRTNHLRYVSCRFKMRSEKKPRILNFYAVVTVSRTVQAVHNFASYKINKAHKNQAKRDNVEDTYSAIYIEINIHHNVI